MDVNGFRRPAEDFRGSAQHRFRILGAGPHIDPVRRDGHGAIYRLHGEVGEVGRVVVRFDDRFRALRCRRRYPFFVRDHTPAVEIAFKFRPHGIAACVGVRAQIPLRRQGLEALPRSPVAVGDDGEAVFHADHLLHAL